MFTGVACPVFCLSVGHERKPCKNGSTDRDANCMDVDSYIGPTNRVLRGTPRSLARERALLVGNMWDILKLIRKGRAAMRPLAASTVASC